MKPNSNERTGDYVLEYWYKDNASTPYNFNAPVMGNITLRAKWTKV
jgi:uncharacterized repeat protein (TIGR02543 family)